ncbi:MAG: hypothetical protein COW24_02525 [Candidatus Kerfeldbacteria bacterium CG15_BIG_FIL_POST_REV_8_21_14_020_45_12]|uniref:Uncharacterized protein n=1 Tax=Candidatus Kerfeldbacteria bacterium CG15_BIG_FIL_POST_REV_8_21_14_020_45_12 TaxID=2014247 RepID=A0A2M7H432_9BACT|nr:MAG: hypothetical protein COW24_02525 [Candidatus Kerfeldbacteria bacterium CG15_BIG_FIL_POST_REV_8_21_14_020_45_12]PJA93502.1 MAG: hypothetical protein CO132_02630 [Candidatus Kerfeldbacteria bacterium CG_4_9_14_3_um_filter_45_8]
MTINREKVIEQVNNFIGRHFGICAGLVIVLVFMLGWFLLLDGEYKTIRESGVLGYESAVENLQSRQERLFSLQDLEKEHKDLEGERLAQINEVLPVGFESTSALNTIQSLAESANLNILSVDISNQTAVTEEPSGSADQTGVQVKSEITSPLVKAAVVTLNVESKDESNYDDLKYFLDVLQSYVPLFNMQTLNYSPDTTSFALQLVTYYLEPPSSL